MQRFHHNNATNSEDKNFKYLPRYFLHIGVYEWGALVQKDSSLQSMCVYEDKFFCEFRISKVR